MASIDCWLYGHGVKMTELRQPADFSRPSFRVGVAAHLMWDCHGGFDREGSPRAVTVSAATEEPLGTLRNGNEKYKDRRWINNERYTLTRKMLSQKDRWQLPPSHRDIFQKDWFHVNSPLWGGTSIWTVLWGVRGWTFIWAWIWQRHWTFIRGEGLTSRPINLSNSSLDVFEKGKVRHGTSAASASQKYRRAATTSSSAAIQARARVCQELLQRSEGESKAQKILNILSDIQRKKFETRSAKKNWNMIGCS